MNSSQISQLLQIISTVSQALVSAQQILGNVSTMIQQAQATGTDLTDDQLDALDKMVEGLEAVQKAFQ
jgi:uncharacterized protein YybS (DUF2232 family)